MIKSPFLIAQLVLLVACNSVADYHSRPIAFKQLPKALHTDLVVLLETDKYVVVTTLTSFNSNYEQWLREHAYLTQDKELFTTVNQLLINQSNKRTFIAWRVDSVAKAKGFMQRLEYRASDLLETNKCFVYNKNSKLIENTCLKLPFSDLGYEGHRFLLSKNTLLEVVDIVY
jgi:hypothetical protein